MEWVIANWWWLSFCIPVVLAGLKVAAKFIPGVWDDKIVTVLAMIWDISRGRTPRHTTGKPKVEKYSRGGEEPED